MNFTPIKIQIYRNLHKKCLSVRWKGKVIGHTDKIFLKNVRFFVSKKGVERIRKRKQKSVVAWVEGELDCCPGVVNWNGCAKFSPYKFYYFYNAENRPVYYADYVCVDMDSVLYKIKL